jgi:uncharacterized membrane protein
MTPSERDEDRHPELGSHDPSRLLALTDGVFAIIMTLLVLDLHVPPEEHGFRLAEAMLEDSLPTLFAFIVSFLLAAVYWIGHRDLFNNVKRVDYAVLWMTVIFLMIASLIPFAASLIGRHGDEPFALRLFGLLIALLASWRLYMFWHVTARPGLLIAPVPERHRRRVVWIMSAAVIAFLGSVALVYTVPTEVVLLVYGATPILMLTLIRQAERARSR